MDWHDPTDNKRVVLGVMKLPAKVRSGPVAPLFINPGVSMLANYGLELIR